MHKLLSYARVLPWFMAMLLSGFLAACGGGDDADVTARAMTTFKLAGVDATISEATKSIAVVLPTGTNVTALVATHSSTGASVKVGATTQVSGVTANDFTSPVTYLVTAPDGTTSSYTVAATVASASAKDVIAFSLGGVAGTVNEAGKNIALTVPTGTDVAAMVATFASAGTGVTVNGKPQISGTTANNFTAPVTYTITADDKSTANYAVTVSVAKSSAKALSAYSLAGVAAAINEATKTVSVTLPAGTSVAALIATYTTTGAGVKVGTKTQVSGSTANNFSNPVIYTVTAADKSTTDYGVTVTVAPGSAKAITAYTLGGIAGTINESAKTIAVPLPSGVKLGALIATFSSTAASIKVGTKTQISGATANDFTNPVVYKATAADSSTANYTVTATVSAAGPAPVPLGSAGSFVILAKSAVSTTGTTAVVGDIGLSPAAATFITGFALSADAGNTFSSSSLVTGKLFAANYAVPTPAFLTTSVSDMETAFTDAAGRTLPDFTELGAGNISGLTLAPGLYKWGTGVLITEEGVTLSGGANDVWIFQIAEDLTVNNSAIVRLSGGAQAKNIFWQVSGQATLGTAADFKGIILSQTLISLNTGAKLTGRALAQTAVTLDATAITKPD